MNISRINITARANKFVSIIHIQAKLRSTTAMNIKNTSIIRSQQILQQKNKNKTKQSKKKHQKHISVLKEPLKSYKTNTNDNGPAQIIVTVADTSSKFIDELLKSLE